MKKKKKLLNRLEQKISSKLSLKSRQSTSMIESNRNHKLLTSSSTTEQNNLPTKIVSSPFNAKSSVNIDNHTVAQKDQQDLDAMHKIVDQTDHDLLHALEHAALRHEQLDELHIRSEEMLSKNENLIYGKIFI